MSPIIEIIFTSIVILITNYFNITDIISKANNNHIIHIFIKFNKMMINQHTIKASLLILLVLLYTIIYIITYGIFYKIYYIKGLFINNSDNVLCYNKQLIKIKFLSNFYFYQKDKKLLFRNFDRLKSIIFTLIIFIIITIFTIKNSKNDIFIFLLIINHFMSLSILFQIIYDNINIEQDKTDLFSLSGISKYDFYIQKNFYSRIVPAIYIFIYNFIILIMFNLQIKQIIIYLLINLFTIFIGSSLVTLISIYMNNIETYSFKNLFYMVKYISKILIYYAIILLITIIALSKYILLGIVIIILLNKITNKLIYFRLTHSIS